MNEIVLDRKSGKLKNVKFDNGDLTKTSADLTGEIKMINNQMKLVLAVSVNDKFLIKFE